MKVQKLPLGATEFFITEYDEECFIGAIYDAQVVKTVDSSKIDDFEDIKCQGCNLYYMSNDNEEERLDWARARISISDFSDELLETYVSREDCYDLELYRADIAKGIEDESYKDEEDAKQQLDVDDYYSPDIFRKLTNAIDLELLEEEREYTDVLENLMDQYNDEGYNDSCSGGREVLEDGSCDYYNLDDFGHTTFIQIPKHCFAINLNRPAYSYIFKVTEDNDLLSYMCGNVYKDGNICWGKNKEPKKLEEVPRVFWQSPFNTDMAGSITKPIFSHTTIARDLLHRELDRIPRENNIYLIGYIAERPINDVYFIYADVDGLYRINSETKIYLHTDSYSYATDQNTR